MLQKLKFYALKNCFLKSKKEDGVDTHFLFGLVLIGFAFWLCFKFRKKK
jgi:hypothetical protein